MVRLFWRTFWVLSSVSFEAEKINLCKTIQWFFYYTLLIFGKIKRSLFTKKSYLVISLIKECKEEMCWYCSLPFVEVVSEVKCSHPPLSALMKIVNNKEFNEMCSLHCLQRLANWDWRTIFTLFDVCAIFLPSYCQDIRRYCLLHAVIQCIFVRKSFEVEASSFRYFVRCSFSK